MKMLKNNFIGIFIFLICLIIINDSISNDNIENQPDRLFMKGFSLESIQNIEFSKSNPNVLNIKYIEIDNYKYYRIINDSILFIEIPPYKSKTHDYIGLLLNLESMKGMYLDTPYLDRMFGLKNLLFYNTYVFDKDFEEIGKEIGEVLLVIDKTTMETDSLFFESINIVGRGDESLYFKVVRNDSIVKNDTTILKFESKIPIDLKETLKEQGYYISKIKYIDDDIIISEIENLENKNTNQNFIRIKTNQFEIQTDDMFIPDYDPFKRIEKFKNNHNTFYFLKLYEKDSVYLPRISKKKLAEEFNKLVCIDNSGNITDIFKALMFFYEIYIFDYRKIDNYLLIKFSDYYNEINSNIYNPKSKFSNDSLALYDMSLQKFIDIDTFNINITDKHIDLNKFNLKNQDKK